MAVSGLTLFLIAFPKYPSAQVPIRPLSGPGALLTASCPPLMASSDASCVFAKLGSVDAHPERLPMSSWTAGGDALEAAFRTDTVARRIASAVAVSKEPLSALSLREPSAEGE